MKTDELRARVYEALALGFRRPEADQLRTLGNATTVDALSDAADLAPGAPSGSAYLGEFRQALEVSGAENLAKTLAVEYARLFLGPDALVCPPYGSMYMDRGILMGPSTLDVIDRYRSEGVKASRGWKEPPDHVCLELAFMAHLSRKYSGALSGGQDEEAERLLHVQARFLRQHLLRWAPSFSVRLEASTTAPLYRLLAGFLPAWLIFDEQLLQALALTGEERSHAECP